MIAQGRFAIFNYLAEEIVGGKWETVYIAQLILHIIVQHYNNEGKTLVSLDKRPEIL